VDASKESKLRSGVNKEKTHSGNVCCYDAFLFLCAVTDGNIKAHQTTIFTFLSVCKILSYLWLSSEGVLRSGCRGEYLGDW
jgi:hypothetical protein